MAHGYTYIQISRPMLTSCLLLQASPTLTPDSLSWGDERLQLQPDKPHLSLALLTTHGSDTLIVRHAVQLLSFLRSYACPKLL